MGELASKEGAQAIDCNGLEYEKWREKGLIVPLQTSNPEKHSVMATVRWI